MVETVLYVILVLGQSYFAAPVPAADAAGLCAGVERTLAGPLRQPEAVRLRDGWAYLYKTERYPPAGP